MRSFLILMVWIASGQIWAQSLAPDNQLRYIDIVPPSPAVASLYNFSRPDVGMVSGTAQYAVPITTVSLAGFNLPITLQYSSNGVRVDEISSRVGHGWQINAGGVITRVVQGTGPDERTIHKVPASTSQSSRDFENFLERISLSTGATNNPDSELDIFSFAAPGMSGRFILDDGAGTSNLNRVVQLSKSNVRIELDSTSSPISFRITDAEGNTFYFGGTGYTEMSRKASTCGKLFDSQSMPTAWFLKKIVLPNNDQITFAYQPVNYQYDVGVNQTMNFANTAQINDVSECRCPVYPSANTCINYIQVNTYYPVSIRTRGRDIEFSYINRPDSGDKLLEWISVSTPSSSYKEHYRLEYQNVYTNKFLPSGLALTSSNNYRPFLKQISRYPEPRNSDFIPLYKFSYDKPEDLPVRLSFAQDHWGYFNAKNNASFIPKPATLTLQNQFPNAVANRNSDPQVSTRGMLTRIEFPTGGYDSIEYEANSRYETRNEIPTDKVVITDQHSIVNYSKAGNEKLVRTFSVGFAQSVLVRIRSTKNPGLTVNPDDYGRIRLVNTTTGGEHVNLGTAAGLSPDGKMNSGFFDLLPGNYAVYIRVMGDNNRSETEIQYIPGDPKLTSKNWPVGGNRVRAVRSFVHTGAIAIIKRIKYGEVSTPDNSVAVAMPEPVYLKGSNFEFQCMAYISPTLTTCTTKPCSYTSMFSTSLINIISPYGSVVSYPTVLEVLENSAGENNGLVQHKFHAVNDVSGSVILGSEILGGPLTNQSIFLHGKERETTVFARSANGYRPVQQVENYFNTRPSSLNNFTCFVVNRLFAPCVYSNSTVPDPREFAPYEALRYSIFSPWVTLDSTVEKTFDQYAADRVIRSLKTYQYTDLESLLPTRITTVNSLGHREVLENSYTSMAENLVAPANQISHFNTLASQNNFDLVKTRTMINDRFAAGYAVEYDDAAGFVIPKNVKEFLIEGVESKAHTVILADDKGNTRERVSNSGVVESYLWEYDQLLPVAKVVGAPVADLAYTSFESSSSGTWSIPAGASIISDNASPTGRMHLRLSSGEISRSGLATTKKYIVSFWARPDHTLQLSGNAVLLSSMSGANGWRNFRYMVAGVSTVTLSGTGSIDELRLYPESAQMWTYTYEPLIGATSACDLNDRILSYDYDDYGRLLMVRDTQGNIESVHDYSYKKSSAPDK